MRSLRGGCGHRHPASRSKASENVGLNGAFCLSFGSLYVTHGTFGLDLVVYALVFTVGVYTEDKGPRPVEQVNLRSPSSRVRDDLMDYARCLRSDSISNHRISPVLHSWSRIPALDGDYSIHLLGLRGHKKDAPNAHVSRPVFGHEASGPIPNDRPGGIFTLGASGWDSKPFGIPFLDGEALFGERYRRVATAAAALGFRLVLFPKQIGAIQAQSFNQYSPPRSS